MKWYQKSKSRNGVWYGIRNRNNGFTIYRQYHGRGGWIDREWFARTSSRGFKSFFKFVNRCYDKNNDVDN